MTLFALVTATTKPLNIILAGQSGGELGKRGRLKLSSSNVRSICHDKKSWNIFGLARAALEYPVDLAGRDLGCLHGASLQLRCSSLESHLGSLVFARRDTIKNM